MSTVISLRSTASLVKCPRTRHRRQFPRGVWSGSPTASRSRLIHRHVDMIIKGIGLMDGKGQNEVCEDEAPMLRFSAGRCSVFRMDRFDPQYVGKILGERQPPVIFKFQTEINTVVGTQTRRMQGNLMSTAEGCLIFFWLGHELGRGLVLACIARSASRSRNVDGCASQTHRLHEGRDGCRTRATNDHPLGR